MRLLLLVTLALSTTFESANLKGLTSMRVIVEHIPGAEKIDLDPSVLQTDIEGTLIKGGLKVTQMAGILPFVYLQMNVLLLPDGCVVYGMHLSLRTGATIVSTKKLIMGELWSDGILGARCKSGKSEVVKSIRQSVVDETNKMVTDILAANQNG